ncbi:MAG: hypothetical protein KIH62_001170 [Candidatus Kerfeldbacteria bacterium]|nr:hypothetical protein [Candidatus Kerfeldbacteria bacterium]
MIAEIVPQARTPRTMTVFDYHIPDGMMLRIGDCVRVPFRTSHVVGLVWNIKEHSESKKLRAVHSLLPVSAWHSKSRCEWLEWFARWYAISLPHAFKTLQHPFPRRVQAIQKHQNDTQQLALDITAHTPPHLVQAQRYTTILQWYKETLRHSKGHTLILCGEHAEAQLVSAYIGKKAEYLIHATPKQLTDLEITLTQTTHGRIIVGTKQLVHMNPNLFSTIILDKEENSSHKQRDLNPRFHVRRALLQAALFARTHNEYFPRLVFTSIAPSIESAYAIEKKQMTSETLHEADAKEPNVQVISMEEEKYSGNYSWFAAEVQKRIQHSKKTLVFLNRTGEYSYNVCQECSAIVEPQSLSCSHCHNNRFKMVRKGITQLEKEARQIFVDKKIARIDRTTDNTQIQVALSTADIIFATEKILHVTTLSIFEYCVILSVDHVLSYPHYSAHERTYQLLRTFFSSGVRCDLQTHSPHHSVITYAASNDYAHFAQEELRIRNMLNAPPYGYRARIINTKTKVARVVTEPPRDLRIEEVLDPEY